MERQYSQSIKRGTMDNANSIIELMVVGCLMCRLGFPGNLADVFGGESIHFAFDYASSFLQLLLIMLCSANNVLEIKLFELKKKYQPVYVMLLIMYAVSLLVSANRVKQTTIILRFSITVFFGLWLADHYEPEHILELLYFAQIGILITNLLTLFVFKSAGYYYDGDYGYTFRGIFGQKNGLGSTFAYGALFQITLFRMKMKKKIRVSTMFWVVLALQLYLLIISKATTAIFCCAVPLVYQILFDRFKREGRIQWGIVYTVASVGFLFVSMTILSLFAPIFEAIGKDATLSGRVPMWEKIIQFLTENNALTGYGLLQFWETPSALKRLQEYFERGSWYRTMAYGAHNNLLEMWLDLGLIGLSAFFLTLIHCFRNVKKMTRDEYIFTTIIILPIMISGFTDRFFTNSNARTMLMFTVMGVAYNNTERNKKRFGNGRRNLDKQVPSVRDTLPNLPGRSNSDVIEQGGVKQ